MKIWWVVAGAQVVRRNGTWLHQFINKMHYHSAEAWCRAAREQMDRKRVSQANENIIRSQRLVNHLNKWWLHIVAVWFMHIFDILEFIYSNSNVNSAQSSSRYFLWPAQKRQESTAARRIAGIAKIIKFQLVLTWLSWSWYHCIRNHDYSVNYLRPVLFMRAHHFYGLFFVVPVHAIDHVRLLIVWNMMPNGVAMLFPHCLLNAKKTIHTNVESKWKIWEEKKCRNENN